MASRQEDGSTAGGYDFNLDPKTGVITEKDVHTTRGFIRNISYISQNDKIRKIIYYFQNPRQGLTVNMGTQIPEDSPVPTGEFFQHEDREVWVIGIKTRFTFQHPRLNRYTVEAQYGGDGYLQRFGLHHQAQNGIKSSVDFENDPNSPGDFSSKFIQQQEGIIKPNTWYGLRDQLRIPNRPIEWNIHPEPHRVIADFKGLKSFGDYQVSVVVPRNLGPTRQLVDDARSDDQDQWGSILEKGAIKWGRERISVSAPNNEISLTQFVTRTSRIAKRLMHG